VEGEDCSATAPLLYQPDGCDWRPGRDDGPNELVWYIFEGEPKPVNGCIELRDDAPGLGLRIKEEALKDFNVIE
jgi:hypothetical protein